MTPEIRALVTRLKDKALAYGLDHGDLVKLLKEAVAALAQQAQPSEAGKIAWLEEHYEQALQELGDTKALLEQVTETAHKLRDEKEAAAAALVQQAQETKEYADKLAFCFEEIRHLKSSSREVEWREKYADLQAQLARVTAEREELADSRRDLPVGEAERFQRREQIKAALAAEWRQKTLHGIHHDHLSDLAFLLVETEAAEAALSAAQDSMLRYHDAWSALDGIMVEHGMSAKAQPDQAQAWLREQFAALSAHREALRELADTMHKFAEVQWTIVSFQNAVNEWADRLAALASPRQEEHEKAAR
jgi:hypothetical protein